MPETRSVCILSLCKGEASVAGTRFLEVEGPGVAFLYLKGGSAKCREWYYRPLLLCRESIYFMGGGIRAIGLTPNFQSFGCSCLT